VRATPGRFPRSPRLDRRGRRPALPLAASPRVRRRPSSRPHHQLHYAGFGVRPPTARTACVALRPTSTRLEPASRLRGFNLLVHFRYAFPSRSTSTGPSGGAGPPRLHRDCSRPHPRFRGQAAANFIPAAATARRRSPFISARSVAPRGAQCRRDAHVALLGKPLDLKQPTACRRGRRRVTPYLRNLRRDPQPRKPSSCGRRRGSFTTRCREDPQQGVETTRPHPDHAARSWRLYWRKPNQSCSPTSLGRLVSNDGRCYAQQADDIRASVRVFHRLRRFE